MEPLLLPHITFSQHNLLTRRPFSFLVQCPLSASAASHSGIPVVEVSRGGRSREAMHWTEAAV